MNFHFVPLVGDLSSYKLHIRYDPGINGNGGGGGSGNAGLVAAADIAKINGDMQSANDASPA